MGRQGAASATSPSPSLADCLSLRMGVHGQLQCWSPLSIRLWVYWLWKLSIELSRVLSGWGPVDRVRRGGVSPPEVGREPSLLSLWMRRVCLGLYRTHWERNVPLPCHGGSHPLRTWKRCRGIHRKNQQGGVWICNSKCFHGPKGWEMSPPADSKTLEY